MLTPRVAVSVIFMLNGAVFASWASRVPALARQVEATEGTLGLALFGATAGLAAAASVAGRICAAIGARVLIAVSGLSGCVLLPSLAFTTEVWQLGVALGLVGACAGALDVAMNVAAVRVVRDTGRLLMPSFHAAFSFGGLLGAVGAAQAAWAGIGTRAHFSVAAGVGVLLALTVLRSIPATQPVADSSADQVRSHGSPLRRPVLWLLAVVALCSAFGEGATADWSALFLTQERGMNEATAATGFALFSVAMGAIRLVGGWFEHRWGPVKVLAVGGVLAGTGWLAAVIVPLASSPTSAFSWPGSGSRASSRSCSARRAGSVSETTVAAASARSDSSPRSLTRGFSPGRSW